MIALVTTQAARGHDHDLDILTAALDAAHQKWQIVNWDDASIDWSQFSIAVLRSTWDYYARLDEFVAWVDLVSAQTTLCNPAEIVRWNVDKRYLQEMSAHGIPVMATTFVSKMIGITQELIAQDVIIKPVVSAGSNNTARHRNDAVAARAQLDHILSNAGVAMVQPYSPTIDSVGETGLVYLGGKFSHAFGKDAVFGEAEQVHNGVHVQEVITARTANPNEHLLGDSVMKFLRNKFGVTPLYARIDMVTNIDGVPEIMEVELTEPSLYLHLDAGSPERAASALANAAAATHR
ncbi:MAG: hypothetical protein EBR47_13125 [Betaproteobacteria bacterium]|nr:hypothetical protein [Betaproteobacteria bacterium]